MGWESLLVGNGMSINVSSYFAYDSLYEEACKDYDGSLDDEDIAIFEEFGTTNFEVVLAKLPDGISLADVLGRSQEPFSTGYDLLTLRVDRLERERRALLRLPLGERLHELTQRLRPPLARSVYYMPGAPS